MSRQAMNYLLGQLERLGYVERRGDHDDARAKRVYETDAALPPVRCCETPCARWRPNGPSSSAQSTSSNSVGY